MNILYTIIIYPIYLIIEIVFKVFDRTFENIGYSIIGVSFVVTLICLPLYLIAEKWQNIERDTIRRLKPKIEKIKSAFKGDERYLILSTYYRQNNYHPLYSLRSSFGILVQIPFFIAAYTFLSHLQILNGSSFYFIRDLGVPDALITINNIKFNLLPVLMTLINCVSGIIYSRKLLLIDKIQIYAVSGIFLLLLYNSPSGLVLYWTMNNILSLTKNIFQLFKKPIKALYVLLCIIALFIVIYVIFINKGSFSKRFIMAGLVLLIPAIPLLINLYKYLIKTVLNIFNNDEISKQKIFLLSIINIGLLTGFLIPSFVINSSPQEFSYIESVSSPFVFLLNSLLQSFGLSVFYPVCLYFLFGKKIKTLLSIIMLSLLFIFSINTFFFSYNYGELSSILTFSNAGLLKPQLITSVVNLLLIFIILILIILIFNFNKMIIFNSSLYIILISFFVISIVHSISINNEYSRLTMIRNSETEKNAVTLSPIFNFSKNGNNILVIFLDRGINAFVPEIFSESPELYEQFSGFTWYPNTISFNGYTLIGAPPFFGGYEYTPKEINKRDSIPLVQKHNEALLLMPVIFSNNNYNVTVTDPPWANYSWMPDTRIYNDYKNINVYNTIRTYTGIWLDNNNFSNIQIKSKLLKRNFLIYSLFKCAPVILHEAIYHNGDWWNTDTLTIDYNLIINNYAVLDFLPELTGIVSDESNNYILFSNELPHEPHLLQAPDYIPVLNVTDKGETKYSDIINYPVNAAALKMLGKWFKYLQQNDLYNNTRIIISSDHGANINTNIFTDFNNLSFNRELFNPLLLVKDFNDNFNLKTDYSFMTNADVPAIAFNNIIQNPINPFTGNPINNSDKNNLQYLTNSSKWMPNQHKSNVFNISDNEWYTVHSDIFNIDNWRKAGN